MGILYKRFAEGRDAPERCVHGYKSSMIELKVVNRPTEAHIDSGADVSVCSARAWKPGIHSLLIQRCLRVQVDVSSYRDT